MANTVTSTDITTFQAGSVARSGQVNSNFDVFRGDLIPINDDTSSASDLTHDLGQLDHRWVDLWVDRIMLSGDTTAGSSIASTTTGINIRVGDTIAGAFSTIGMDRVALGARSLEISTSTGAGTRQGNIFTSALLDNVTNASWHIFSNFEITPKGGIIQFGLIPGGSNIRSRLEIDSTTASNQVWFTIEARNGSGTTIASIQLGKTHVDATNPRDIFHPTSLDMLTVFGFTPGAVNTLSVSMIASAGGANSTRVLIDKMYGTLKEP
jgi:hypothetical protein